MSSFKDIIPEGKEQVFGIFNEEQEPINEMFGGDIAAIIGLLGGLILFGKAYYDSVTAQKIIDRVSSKLDAIFGNASSYEQLLADVYTVYKGSYADRMKGTIEKMKKQYDAIKSGETLRKGSLEDKNKTLGNISKEKQLKEILKKFSNLKVAGAMKKEKGEE
jgi:hypothetical protein